MRERLQDAKGAGLELPQTPECVHGLRGLRGHVRVGLALPLVVVGMTALEATPARAETLNTYYVSTTGGDPDCATAANNSSAPFGTIQAALDCTASDATSASSPDAIDVAAGTYDENGTVESNVNLVGSSASTTVVDGTYSGTVMTVTSGNTVAISGLSIENGQATNGVSGGLGEGGGNGADGGGIYNSGELTLTNDTITGSAAGFGGTGGPNYGYTGFDGGNGGNGGGVYSVGTLTLMNDTITGNTAGRGGDAENGVYDGNGGDGGNGGGVYSTEELTFVSDTITGNTAGAGGNGGNGGNGGAGGGVYSSANLTATYATFSGNSAGDLGHTNGMPPFLPANNGTYGLGGGISGAATLANTVLANNVLADDAPNNCSGTITDGGYNISFPSSDTSCPGTFASGDPALGPLQDNGGPTQTMAIDPTSSAFEEVPLASCTASTDQRGEPRPGMPGQNCDAGAFEHQQQYTVTFDPNGGSGTMAPETENVPTPLTANTFTYLGCSFSDWNTLKDGTGTSYADGAVYDFSVNITLYAQWAAIAVSSSNPTTTTLSSSANPALAGQKVTYEATVSPVPDAGAVSFADDGDTRSGCGSVPLNASTGTATCALVYSTRGTHTVTASYSGDTTFAPSTSNSLTEVIKPGVVRVFGEDAIGTAIAVSQAQFQEKDSAKAVVLARSDFFSDAVAGGPLAAKLDAPLLITPGASLSSNLDPRVLTEIQRVLPAAGTVYVLGGDLALSPQIDTTLENLGYKVTREAGADEYATAVDIAEALGDPATVFEATGTDFYDSMSAVPAAVETHGAILLTDGTTQAPETASYLASHPSDSRYAIGGPLAAAGADPTATAVYGQDVYGTAAAVAQRFFAHPTSFGSATSASFSDAFVAGPALGSEGAPMLLVLPTGAIPNPISRYLGSVSSGLEGGTLFGGPLAVGDDVLGELNSLL